MTEDLLGPHRPAMFSRALRRVGNEADAEEMVQEALLRAHRAREALQDPQAALAWLLRITDRVCLDRQRSKRPEGADLPPPDELAVPDPAPTGLQMAEQEEMTVCTSRYLEQLPPGLQEVLVLRDVEGHSAREVAARLGLTEGAVKTRLHRARAALRGLLREACTFSRDERNVFVCEPKPPGGGA